MIDCIAHSMGHLTCRPMVFTVRYGFLSQKVRRYVSIGADIYDSTSPQPIAAQPLDGSSSHCGRMGVYCIY